MKVNRGDTLWAISKRTGVPVQELARLNGINDANRIREGQELYIPGFDKPNLNSMMYQTANPLPEARHSLSNAPTDTREADRARFSSDLARAIYEPMMGGLVYGGASRFIRPAQAAVRSANTPPNSPPISSMDEGFVHPYNGPVGGGAVPTEALRTMDDRFAPTTQQGWSDLIAENPTLQAMYNRYGRK